MVLREVTDQGNMGKSFYYVP